VQGSLTIARVLGINVQVHFSWILVAGLVLVTFREEVQPFVLLRSEYRWLAAALMTLFFFGSVLAHELSHAVVARAFRLEVKDITLFVFGGVANLPREPDDPKAEFTMAAVGPLMSLALAGLFWGGGRAAESLLRGSPGLITVYAFDRLALVNALLGVFNLLPGFPLDGGRVLRSIWWAISRNRRAATRAATRGGQILAGVLLVAGLVQLVGDRELFINGMWSILIAIFLYNAATGYQRQESFEEALRGINVGTLMTRDLAYVPADLPLSSLVSTYVLPMRGRAFPVERSGDLVGLVSIGAVRRMPREQWQTRRVAEVMTSLEGRETLAPSDDGARGWTALLRNGTTEIPVLENGRLVGLLERDVVIDYLRMRQTLGLDSRRR
jgi:Zn-dependent protease